MVFVESDDARRTSTALTSVGGGIATGEDYDVIVVRHVGPSKVRSIESISPSVEDATGAPEQ